MGWKWHVNFLFFSTKLWKKTGDLVNTQHWAQCILLIRASKHNHPKKKAVHIFQVPASDACQDLHLLLIIITRLLQDWQEFVCVCKCANSQDHKFLRDHRCFITCMIRPPWQILCFANSTAQLFVGLAYQGKDIVFRFIMEYSSLRDFL